MKYALLFFVAVLSLFWCMHTCQCQNQQNNRQNFQFPGGAQQRPAKRPNSRPQTQRPGATTTPVPGVVFQFKDCECPSTFEFNPVCGTDGVTYANSQKLKCAQICGAKVQLAKQGSCVVRLE